MAEMIARFKPGANLPGFATAAVSAGRFVAVTGPKTAQGDYAVAHAGSGVRALGVSERDALGPTDAQGRTVAASDWRRRFNIVRRGAIARVTAGAALTAGQFVMSDATGQAVVYTPPTVDPTATTAQPVPAEPAALGRVLNTVALGEVAEVDLF